MVPDQELLLSDNEAPVNAAGAVDLTTGTSFSKRVIRRRLHSGNAGGVPFAATDPLYLYLQIMEAADSAGAATLNIQLVSSAAEALSSPTVHWETGVLAFDEGTFDLGQVYTPRFDPRELWKEYIGLLFVIAAADLTALKTFAHLTDHVDVRSTFATGDNFGA